MVAYVAGFLEGMVGGLGHMSSSSEPALPFTKITTSEFPPRRFVVDLRRFADSWQVFADHCSLQILCITINLSHNSLALEAVGAVEAVELIQPHSISQLQLGCSTDSPPQRRQAQRRLACKESDRH